MLAKCWEEFNGGSEEGMQGQKLTGRMEAVSWISPLLKFVIERHGGTVLGSTRAGLHHWEVNLDCMTAIIIKKSHRQLKPMADRVDVKPIAKKLAVELLAHKECDYFKWMSDNKVQVVFTKIFGSDSGYEQTVIGRRKRCRTELEKQLQDYGWKHTRTNVFENEGEERRSRC